jgi:REP element-mobilizing transposase RayT
MNRERRNIRLKGWDYSSEGVYFITICCKDRQPFFGKINDENVTLSEIGFISKQFWLEIPVHFPHIRLDEFVIMPNHIHGIIILDYSLVGTRHGMTLRYYHNSFKNFNQFSQPVKNSVSVIINQYKSSVTRWCNKHNFNEFHWQSRFYEQILHNETAIDGIREYIYRNPKSWQDDEFYTL